MEVCCVHKETLTQAWDRGVNVYLCNKQSSFLDRVQSRLHQPFKEISEGGLCRGSLPEERILVAFGEGRAPTAGAFQDRSSQYEGGESALALK